MGSRGAGSGGRGGGGSSPKDIEVVAMPKEMAKELKWLDVTKEIEHTPKFHEPIDFKGEGYRVYYWRRTGSFWVEAKKGQWGSKSYVGLIEGKSEKWGYNLRFLNYEDADREARYFKLSPGGVYVVKPGTGEKKIFALDKKGRVAEMSEEQAKRYVEHLDKWLKEKK